MRKDRGYGLLWMSTAQVVLFTFSLAITPRLNVEGLLYQSAVSVAPEGVLSKDDDGSFELKYGAGYPCTEPTGYMTSVSDLQKDYIGAWEADASLFQATGIYEQTNHRTRPPTRRGYYSSRSPTYGVTAPAITRSWWTTFWMRPYMDHAQYYLTTFKDGTRTWALVDNAITRMPTRGKVALPVGYYWDEGVARFLTNKEKKVYRTTDRDVLEDNCLGNALDLYSDRIEGDEMR